MKIFTIACFCIFSTIVCKAIEKDSREIKYAAVLAVAALVLFHSVAFVKDLISVFDGPFHSVRNRQYVSYHTVQVTWHMLYRTACI